MLASPPETTSGQCRKQLGDEMSHRKFADARRGVLIHRVGRWGLATRIATERSNYRLPIPTTKPCP